MALSSARLPREVRVRRRADFTALRNSGGRAGGHCFNLRYAPNALGYARLGLAISKHVSKRAVDRNRLKRLLRESFRRVRNRLPAVDLVVMAREPAAAMEGSRLLPQIDELWEKLRVAYARQPAPSVHH